MGKNTGPVGSCSPHRAAALALLDRYPSGKHSRDIACIVDMTPGRAAKMMHNLLAAGVVKTLAEGNAEHSRRVRYYLPQHEAEAMAAHDAEKGKTWGFGRKAPTGVKVRKASTVAAALAPHSMRSGAEPLRTVAQPFVDRRFVPERVEPFFSAMRPGNYLRTGSAIERAYGGER